MSTNRPRPWTEGGRRIAITVMLSLALLVGLSAAAARAQDGSISGTVTNIEGGDPIAGTTIILGGTRRDATTGEDGTYSLAAPPGEYLVLAAASGYGNLEKSVTVVSGETATLDFELASSLTAFGDEVVVLGSRAQRTAIETPVPVDVLSADDIESSGMSETSRIVQFLAPSFNFSTSTISDGTDIVRPSTLRGLGPDQTLVLVNGKRRHNSALIHVNGSIGRGTAGVDLNSIPSSAIERIEILRDGAAAQYGSDAIAGVMNIILKSSTGTTQVDLGTGQHYEGDGGLLQASANRGWKIGDDGGFFNITAEYRDRDWTNRAGNDPRRIFNFLEQELFEPALSEGTLDPREATYDRLNHRYGDAASENGYLWLNSEIPLGNSSEFYFFGGVSQREGESAGFNRLPSQSRTNILVQPEGHLPLINTEVDDISLSAGFRKNWNRWAMDLSTTFGDNEFNFFISNSANTSIGPLSPTEADAGTLGFDQLSFNLDFYGTGDWGLTNPVNIAAGLEWRQDTYEIKAGNFVSFGDGGFPDQFGGTAPFGIQVFPGFRPSNAVNESRDNVAAYVDLEMDLSTNFLLGVAVRYEDYSDFGNTVIGKLAGRYEVNDRFALRGSAQTGFRAPSLHQSNFNNVSTQFVDVEGELVPLEVGTFRVESPVSQALGAQPLKEEDSVSYSLGFTVRPAASVSITADAYSIKIDDRVVLSGRFTATDPDIADLLEPFGVNGAQFFTNAIDTETEGFDLVAAWSTRIGSRATYSLTGAFSWTSTDITKIRTPPELIGKEQTLFPVIDQTYVEEAQPGSAYSIGNRYTRGAWSTVVRFNYFGSVTSTESNTDPARKQTFGGKWLTDLDVAYTFDMGLTLHLGANNIFDVFPDKNIASNSFNGIFVYPRRTAPFGFNGGYYYLNASFKF